MSLNNQFDAFLFNKCINIFIKIHGLCQRQIAFFLLK